MIASNKKTAPKRKQKKYRQPSRLVAQVFINTPPLIAAIDALATKEHRTFTGMAIELMHRALAAQGATA